MHFLNYSFVTKICCQDFQTKELIQYVGIFYRKVQILVLICDKCFQSYVWPIIQFYGALILINLLYVLIMFHQQLPQSGVVALVLLFVSGTSIICLILRTGSRSISISRKVLQRVTVWSEHNQDKWAKRFFKSCSKIAIRVGSFHKMDSERAPSFIRFILQRTFFFVLKTKLGIKSNTIDMAVAITH